MHLAIARRLFQKTDVSAVRMSKQPLTKIFFFGINKFPGSARGKPARLKLISPATHYRRRHDKFPSPAANSKLFLARRGQARRLQAAGAEFHFRIAGRPGHIRFHQIPVGLVTSSRTRWAGLCDV